MTDLRGWRLCPRCGADVAPEAERACCAACGYAAYANPGPAVCALVLDDRARLLLGRRAGPPCEGLWDALGGFVHEDEHGLDGLRRELREETGCQIEPLDFVGAFADRYGEGGNATLNLYWTARLVSGDPRPDDDVAELRWFPLDELPPDGEIAFENTKLALTALRSRRTAPLLARGVFEIQLVTRDLARLEAFYRDRLSLTVSLRDEHRGRVHFRLGRGQLILAVAGAEVEAAPGWSGLPPALLVRDDARGPTPPAHGPVHFALEVARVDAVTEGERLRREGLDVRGPFRWPGGQLSVYVRDPDGNVVELIG